MSIAVLGEAIVDLIRQSDGQYQPHLGGSPFNVAVCAARQGAAVSYLSPLSDDSFGDQFCLRLNEEGVNISHRSRSSLPTSLALIMLDPRGQPTYRLYRDGVADKDVSADDILANMPAETQIFHTGSLAITPDYLPTIKKVIEALKRRNILISIDINIRDKAYPDLPQYIAGVQSILSLADIIKASDEDLSFLGDEVTARSHADAIVAQLDHGLLLFTCGEDGGVLLSQHHEIEFTAAKVDNFVDAIGAGDTFYATFLAQISAQILTTKTTQPLDSIDAAPLRRALDYATKAAGINVARAGCNPPTLAELEGN